MSRRNLTRSVWRYVWPTMVSEIFCKGFNARQRPKRPWLGTTGPTTVFSHPFIIVQLTHAFVHFPVSVWFFHFVFSLIGFSFHRSPANRPCPAVSHLQDFS